MSIGGLVVEARWFARSVAADDLATPELGVLLVISVTAWTPTSKTIIGKDRYLFSREGEVRLARQVQVPAPSGNLMVLEQCE